MHGPSTHPQSVTYLQCQCVNCMQGPIYPSSYPGATHGMWPTFIARMETACTHPSPHPQSVTYALQQCAQCMHISIHPPTNCDLLSPPMCKPHAWTHPPIHEVWPTFIIGMSNYVKCMHGPIHPPMKCDLLSSAVCKLHAHAHLPTHKKWDFLSSAVCKKHARTHLPTHQVRLSFINSV